MPILRRFKLYSTASGMSLSTSGRVVHWLRVHSISSVPFAILVLTHSLALAYCTRISLTYKKFKRFFQNLRNCFLDILPSLAENKVCSVFITVCANEDDTNNYIRHKNVVFAVTKKEVSSYYKMFPF
jgi:hypothetical protein